LRIEDLEFKDLGFRAEFKDLGVNIMLHEVLLCEDNEMNRELIVKRFLKAGLKTSIAENGKIGVETAMYRFRNNLKQFAIIFMDINMPVMNGTEASVEIRKFAPEIPIIAISPNHTPEEIKNYINCGITDWLNKPFTSKELSDCLIKYLKNYNDSEKISSESNEKELNSKLIQIFLRNNKFKYDEIIKSVEENDIKTAHRLVHTLKGNAILLGEEKLQKASEDMEILLANYLDGSIEVAVSRILLDILKFELETVLKKYKQIGIHQKRVNADSEIPQKTEVIKLLDKLEILLNGGDLECLNMTEQLRLIPGSDELIRQIEYFEFENAAETLKLFRSEILSRKGAALP
jgi:CheY-like chemotaxis protein